MSGDDLAALHATVRGRVQGVGFREFVLTHARVLRLTGWVRNGSDGGTVEVVAEGPRVDVSRLLDYLRRGPRGARVDAVDITWSEPTGHFDGFRVAS